MSRDVVVRPRPMVGFNDKIAITALTTRQFYDLALATVKRYNPYDVYAYKLPSYVSCVGAFEQIFDQLDPSKSPKEKEYALFNLIVCQHAVLLSPEHRQEVDGGVIFNEIVKIINTCQKFIQLYDYSSARSLVHVYLGDCYKMVNHYSKAIECYNTADSLYSRCVRGEKEYRSATLFTDAFDRRKSYPEEKFEHTIERYIDKCVKLLKGNYKLYSSYGLNDFKKDKQNPQQMLENAIIKGKVERAVAALEAGAKLEGKAQELLNSKRDSELKKDKKFYNNFDDAKRLYDAAAREIAVGSNIRPVAPVEERKRGRVNTRRILPVVDVHQPEEIWEDSSGIIAEHDGDVKQKGAVVEAKEQSSAAPVLSVLGDGGEVSLLQPSSPYQRAADSDDFYNSHDTESRRPLLTPRQVHGGGSYGALGSKGVVDSETPPSSSHGLRKREAGTAAERTHLLATASSRVGGRGGMGE